MGKITSAATLSSTAYLTETGRRYLFGKDKTGNPIRFNSDNSDNFEITHFALLDGDRNYKTASNFSTGEMPDISGTADSGCLKTASDIGRISSIVYKGTISNSNADSFLYRVEPAVTQFNLDSI